MKAYVITRGDYSDYSIVGVTLDKQKARKIVKLFDDTRYKARIEEYDLDEFTGNEKPGWSVYFYESDPPLAIRSIYFDYGGMNRRNMKPLICPMNGSYNGIIYTVGVQADDEEHAIKIAADELARYRAEKEGIS